jgi:hypothetical protein
VVRLAGPVSQSLLAKEVKGASSHLVTHRLAPDAFFRWQGAYASFSFSKSALDKVVHYVERQEEHHGGNSLLPWLEVPEIVDGVEPD